MRTTCLQDDDSFDRLLPEWSCRVSRGNWTPLAVARRAAELLVAEPGTYVLDVGSGVGKLCMVGALTTSGHFHGVEQRPHFVAAARAVAARLELRQVGFTVGHVTAVEWQQFNSFYLFNPFGFADYEIKNNGANIRGMRSAPRPSRSPRPRRPPRLRARTRIEDSPAENRVRLFFPSKPATRFAVGSRAPASAGRPLWAAGRPTGTAQP